VKIAYATADILQSTVEKRKKTDES